MKTIFETYLTNRKNIVDSKDFIVYNIAVPQEPILCLPVMNDVKNIDDIDYF